MPAPGVTTILEDQSQIQQIVSPATDNTDRPILMVASSADKGFEEWKAKVFGQDFFDIYGEAPSFIKHGQALIQAANAINAGAYVTFKRVVAEDSTLANIGVVATVTKEYKQKINDTGSPLYFDNDKKKETTDSNNGKNKPVMENYVRIKYELKSIISDGNSLQKFSKLFYDANHHTGNIGENDHYCLFLITDSGRGASNKRFRIYQDTSNSKPLSYVRYFIDIIENGNTLETLAFTMNPDIIEKERNMSLQNIIKIKSKQVRAKFFDDEYAAFAQNVSYLMGEADNTFEYGDVLFGTDLNSNAYPNLQIDNLQSGNGANLSSVYGIALENGSNGNFGARPIEHKEQLSIQLVKAFDGSFDDCIYDLDNNRIDAIFDANYPKPVKRAIEQLVNFREDCVYFRDMGLDIRSLEDVRLANYENAKSRYCCTYLNSYNVYDPYTYKEINVTVMYDLVRLFVKHFIDGRSRPFCGQKYGIIIPADTFVEGSLNWAPTHTPRVDQFKELDDLRVNYLAFYNGNILTMNSEYTSQTEYTQLSWLNNVLAVQQVIKAIREFCPKARYTFLDGDDLTKYKKDVNDLIVNKYSSLFKSFEVTYVDNDLYASNKIIYAVLKVKFRNFIQTEYFKIIALPS